MALTRKFLTAMGIEADKVDEIINAHASTVDALKEERDNYKAKAEKNEVDSTKIADLEKEVETLRESQKESYKVKYEALKEEYSDYKKGVENEKTKATKLGAFKELLKDIGISEKRIESIVKVSDINSIKLTKEGKIDGVDDLKKSLTEEWEDFIVKEQQRGANTHTPPAGEASKKTKEEILAIKDTAARQAAMLENKDLFI